LLKVGRTILKYLTTDNIEAAYYEEIYRLTTIDGLTRCYNARFCKEALVREASRATRYHRPLSLLMFDLDDFARINEEFGHLAGDAVLAQIGKRLGRRVRREDIFARTGGGEFALVIPEVDRVGAGQVANRILRAVGETAFGFDDVQIPVSLSIGGCSLTEVAEDAEAKTAPALRDGSISQSSIAGFGTLTEDGSGSVSSSRSGEIADRFHHTAEAMFALARQRLSSAKAHGKGTLQMSG
jgi:diguanylate cyclase (GGDEF)-like protein